MGIRSQDSYGKGSSKKCLRSLHGKECRTGNVFLFRENKDYSHRYRWTFLKKWMEKKQNRAPMWEKLMKNVDLDEPTSFLDLV